MQQRQLRLGDILDDYCPRERRVTNHAVVAMVGDDVKQTRCSTCETEHEYKRAKVPRLRRKADTQAALYSQVLANGPKRVVHESPSSSGSDPQLPAFVEDPGDTDVHELSVAAADNESGAAAPEAGEAPADADVDRADEEEEGPVHRPLIRASLPKIEGQQPPSRPIPEFTIRQPAGRHNRFRSRQQQRSGSGGGGGFGGGQGFQGNRSNGNGPGGPPRGARSGGGRPHQPGVMSSSRPDRRSGPGRNRGK
jgi:hypothetical protein